MSPPPRVAIVVVNYNGRDLLERYLPSLLDLDYGNFEVVVVDNDSDDDSVAFLREEFPEVRVLASDANLGFSKANNVGASAVPDAEYLWFVNNDVRVEPDSLGTLVDHLESTPETAMVCPRINYVDEPETIQSVGFDCPVSTVSTPRDQGQTAPTNPEPHPVSYGAGAALLVDRGVFDGMGGFDGDNFFFGDDVYLGIRCWLEGHRVEAVPDAVVYHEVGGTRERSVDPTLSYHFSRGHVRTLLTLLEPRSLLRGAPRFLLHVLYLAVADALYWRSPRAAACRLLGYVAPLRELPGLLRQRASIQRRRKRPDSAFTDPTDGS
jgi:GT2 family glycosyltransferase